MWGAHCQPSPRILPTNIHRFKIGEKVQPHTTILNLNQELLLAFITLPNRYGNPYSSVAPLLHCPNGIPSTKSDQFSLTFSS
jgi:hypothetical protein